MLGRKLIPVEVSAAAYDEIALAMITAHAVVMMIDGALDMRSIGLLRGEEPEPAVPRHRPIAPPPPPPPPARPVTGKKNTAPGAI